MSSWQVSGSTTSCKEHYDNNKTLKILYIDLFGPIAYISIDVKKYGLVIIDDYSHFA
jgi:hypothetical protein